MRLILSLAGVLVCAQAAAEEINLSFNGDAVRAGYIHALQARNLQIDAGWLHHQDAGDVIHVGLNLASIASEGTDPVQAGLGGELTYFDGDLANQSGYTAAIGGFVRYTVPGYNRIVVGGRAYFGPGILSGGDADQFQDLSVRVSYNVMRDADIFIGARYVKGEYDNAPDARFDTGLHVGINLRF